MSQGMESSMLLPNDTVFLETPILPVDASLKASRKIVSGTHAYCITRSAEISIAVAND